MKAVFIIGPTAVGKSALALRLAEIYDAEIINSDSIQFFKSVNIGSSKPKKKDLNKTPHHLFDILSEGHEFTAGEFKKLCLSKLSKIKTEYAFIVGGSGFYINALISEMYNFPKTPIELKNILDHDLKNKGLAFIYEEIKKKDPEYAATINQNDKYRILRAASIMRLQDRTITEIKRTYVKKQFPYPYVFLRIEMDKSEIKKNVTLRTKQMLDNGLIEEVQGLLDKGLKNWSPMNSVGYKETIKFIEGSLSKQELEEEIVKSTMKLVKKQNTWFNRYESEQYKILKVKHNENIRGIMNKIELTLRSSERG